MRTVCLSAAARTSLIIMMMTTANTMNGHNRLANAKGMAVGWSKEKSAFADDWKIGAMCVFRAPTHWMELPHAP